MAVVFRNRPTGLTSPEPDIMPVFLELEPTLTTPSTPSGGFSGSVLVGDLEAVPEPSAFTVLGIGAFGLLVRRRVS